MRRSDKEIKDPLCLDKILKKAQICRIGLIDCGQPYIVPMNFGFQEGCMYLHSTFEGRKIEALKLNNQVCFEVEIGTELVRGKTPCEYGMKYYSIIGWGRIEFLKQHIDKINALDIIMSKYAPDEEHRYDRGIVDELILMVLEIDELTGKISGHSLD